MDPRQLADADSLFCEFKGVDIHYKLCEPEPEPESPSMLAGEVSSQAGAQTRKLGLPMILLHGFGASAFSWHRVMKPFAQITGILLDLLPLWMHTLRLLIVLLL